MSRLLVWVWVVLWVDGVEGQYVVPGSRGGWKRSRSSLSSFDDGNDGYVDLVDLDQLVG